MKFNAALLKVPVLFLLCSICFVASCTPKKVLDKGDLERRYVRDGSQTAHKTEEKIAFYGDYVFKIRQNRRDRSVCEGTAKITRYSSYTKTEGEAKCSPLVFRISGSRTIEINDYSNGQVTPVKRSEYEKEDMKHLDKRITRVRKLGNVEYIPYKPDFIGPIIQNVLDFADVDETQALSVKYVNEDGAIEQDSGKINFKVKEVNKCTGRTQTFYPDYKGTVHFQMNASGFEKKAKDGGLRAKSNIGIYNVFELCLKTKPLSIMNVHIEGKASDFEGPGFTGKLGDFFTKGVIIDIELKNHVIGQL